MDQYVTTYRKDYLWPYVRTYPLREGPTYATVSPPRGPFQGAPCTCGGGPGGEVPVTETVAPLNADSYEWSRLGPLGPLLDPKLYPAKVGSSPETPGMRIDQPNTYLKKLQEKYPYLYNVLQSAPPDDMLKRINVDRLRTTYQVDFDHLDEHPSGDYKNLVKESGVDGPEPCPPPTQLPGVDFRPTVKPIKRVEGNCTSRRPGKQEDGSSLRTAIPAWKSEYADGISKTGHAIIKDKLHQHAVIGWIISWRRCPSGAERHAVTLSSDYIPATDNRYVHDELISNLSVLPYGDFNQQRRLGRANRFRKAFGSPPDGSWQSEVLQRTNSNYGRHFFSDHNLKLPEGKSSEDSAADLDMTEDHQINYPRYGTGKLLCGGRDKPTCDFGYEIGSPSPRREDGDIPVNGAAAVHSRADSGADEFAAIPTGMPKAVIAAEKLKRLKDLQQKRELTERYYSQEIRKLITEYYRSSGNSGDSRNKQDETSPIQEGVQQICTIGKEAKVCSPRTASNHLKALEPCGTMTTITRLDCGCMQETTRPIFTTSRGRVESRNCRHGQTPALLRLASSNPREHLSSLNFNDERKLIGVQNSSVMINRHRPGRVDHQRIIQPRTSSAVSNFNKRTLQQRGSGYSTGCDSQFIGQSRLMRPETAGSSFTRDNPENRNLSPLRKYSDTSTD